MLNIILVGVLTCIVLENALGQSDADLEKELKLHNIYKTYNKNPTPEASWSLALGKAKINVYQIQKDDNLWSLSETFFGDSNFWPKLWAVNTQGIENPHELIPGKTIKFVSGTMGEPPQVTVDDKITEDMSALLSKAQIPSEKTHSESGKVPKSLPDWTWVSESSDQAQIKTVNGESIGLNIRPEFFLTHYLSNEKEPAVGTVIETDLGSKTVGENQYLILKADRPRLEKNYVVVSEETRPMEVSFLDIDDIKEFTMVTVLGQIEIQDMVNSEEGLYRALVTKSIHPIPVGAKVLQKKIETVNVGGGSKAPKVQARIIGGHFDKKQKLYGLYDTVFLNAGSSNQLAEGQIVPIYKSIKIRKEKTEQMQNSLLIGEVKIVKVTSDFSTAIVVKVKDDIRTGDITNPDM